MFTVISIVVLIISVVIHEYAHGWVAYKLGDPTAKNEGRLTLNPLPHIDVLGSLLLPGLLIATGSSFLIGWAKPVPVRPEFFKEPVKGMMWVALAGPVSNFILMTLALIPLKFLDPIHISQGSVAEMFFVFLLVMIQLNLILGLFNLFPIPPLDGSRILMYLLPQKGQILLFKLESYGFLIIFVLVYFNVFDYFIKGMAMPLLNMLL